jgi:hypothetical protein
MDDQQFDAFMTTLTDLLTEVAELCRRQERINAEQQITNHRLELLILEVLRQRQGDNPH